MKNTIVTIQASLYHAMLAFSAVNDVRYYLNGLKIEKNTDGPGVLIIATDGHRCFVCCDELGSITGDDENIILSQVKAPKSAKNNHLLRFTDVACDLLDVAGQAVAMTSHSFVSEARYPDWRRVTEKSTQPVAPTSLNPAYLIDIQALACALLRVKKSAFCGVRIETYGDYSTRILFQGGQAYGVIMPVRSEKCDTPVPAFMRYT